MNAEQVFRSKAPGIMAQLMRDFPIISPIDAGAILGNLGAESNGLTTLQEISPTVKGSKGGYGWAQWTGPRRRAYEAYCQRTNKNPASDEANYAYLFLELKGVEGSEGKAISKLTSAPTLEKKVIAFELAFLRAGIKHYDSRQRWARIAMEAWNARLKEGMPIPTPTPAPPVPDVVAIHDSPLPFAIIIGGIIVIAVVAYVIFGMRF